MSANLRRPSVRVPRRVRESRSAPVWQSLRPCQGAGHTSHTMKPSCRHVRLFPPDDQLRQRPGSRSRAIRLRARRRPTSLGPPADCRQRWGQHMVRARRAHCHADLAARSGGQRRCVHRLRCTARHARRADRSWFAKRGASTVKVVVNEANVPARVCLVLQDEDGKSLVARADASRSIARRLLLTADPSAILVAMFEVQPWARDPGRQLTVDIELAEGPSRFVFDQPLTFAGCLEDGSLVGTFAGRLSEILIGTRLLPDSEVAELAKASDNPTALTHGDLQSPSHELRGRFLRDIDRLRHWYRAPRLSLDDMHHASLMLFRCLFSTHPLMPVLCRKL